MLKWSYALHLRPVISEVAQRHCNGCHFDHPSQLEHDVCILMPFAEQVNQWFEDALSIVNMDMVIGNWLGNLVVLHLVFVTMKYQDIWILITERMNG